MRDAVEQLSVMCSLLYLRGLTVLMSILSTQNWRVKGHTYLIAINENYIQARTVKMYGIWIAKHAMIKRVQYVKEYHHFHSFKVGTYCNVTAYRNAVSWQCGRDSWPRNISKRSDTRGLLWGCFRVRHASIRSTYWNTNRSIAHILPSVCTATTVNWTGSRKALPCIFHFSNSCSLPDSDPSWVETSCSV
jgi:hypothetical protein